MSNYITKTPNTNLSNMTALSILPCHAYDDALPASKAGRRFLHAASLLPENGFLGWQVSPDREGRPSVSVFSGPDVSVVPEDFGWMFQTCATVSSGCPNVHDTFWENRRKVYGLRYLPKKNDAVPECVTDGTTETDRFCGMPEILSDTGAAIRILAGSAGKGCAGRGSVLISLPGEIPLRMRTALSLVFPHTAVTELNETAGFDRQLPAECLADGMTGLLRMLIRRQEQITDSEDECLFLEPDEDEDDRTSFRFSEKSALDEAMNAMTDNKAESPAPNDNSRTHTETGFTPLDELDLSVRSYNCLRRAGIESIERLRTMSDADLLGIRNLSRRCLEEIRQKLAELPDFGIPVPSAVPDYSAMLDGLVGLSDVKEQVRKIRAFAKMQRDMKSMSKDGRIPMVLNMEFVGNPGTAKTTVAKILAGIFYEAGLLCGSEPVEAGRADLIAKYEGQTADKVKTLFQKAKGRLLFIDEAYALVEGFDGLYGDEAINTIVQEMENNRNDTIVIFAGYPDEMDAFFSRNPGLRSRVPFKISFRDYTAGELVRIAELEAQNRGFAIQPRAVAKVTELCRTATKDANAGNGRFCRNLVESAILAYAARVYGGEHVTEKKDFTLLAEDFSVPDTRQEERAMPIGFRM